MKHASTGSMNIVNNYLHYSEQEDCWYYMSKPPDHAKLVVGYIIPLVDNTRRTTHFSFDCCPDTLWRIDANGEPKVL